MRSRLRPFAPAVVFFVSFAGLGCIGGDEETPATAVPTTTGIPMGAPGAVGAHVEPPPPPSLPRPPRSEGVEQKINPGTGPEPVIPPSPFGSPLHDEPPSTTTKKKPKGTAL
ncbi:MAG: hypothetical protein IPM54_28415 [Polyangiaceae bacterium]|nr:hypothetical protein [Polyangiaceae bacterium]